MDLNFIFNQHLKTVGLLLKNVPDEDFKTLKILTRQLQNSIAETLLSKIYRPEGENPLDTEDWHYNSLQSVRVFINSTLTGGKDEQAK